MPRLLLIEDDQRILSGLQQLLAKPDRDFLVASSVAEAVRRVAQGTPIDLALVDHHLPDGNGLEVVGELRRLHPGVHVIIMTADPSLEHALLAMDRGVQAYVQKPFDAVELRYRIDEALAQRQGTLDAVDWARVFDAVDIPLVVLDEHTLVRRCNRAALRLSGAGSEAAAIGRRLVDLPGGPWKQSRAVIDQIGASGSSSAMLQIADEKSGKSFRVCATRLKRPSGGEAGFAMWAIELGEVEALRDEVARLKRRLRESEG